MPFSWWKQNLRQAVPARTWVMSDFYCSSSCDLIRSEGKDLFSQWNTGHLWMLSACAGEQDVQSTCQLKVKRIFTAVGNEVRMRSERFPFIGIKGFLLWKVMQNSPWWWIYSYQLLVDKIHYLVVELVQQIEPIHRITLHPRWFNIKASSCHRQTDRQTSTTTNTTHLVCHQVKIFLCSKSDHVLNTSSALNLACSIKCGGNRRAVITAKLQTTKMKSHRPVSQQPSTKDNGNLKSDLCSQIK